jgi:hypothetical protein
MNNTPVDYLPILMQFLFAAGFVGVTLLASNFI